MYLEKRKSGISLIGDLPWGSHFCLFYRDTDGRLDILLPYFNAGLENNELCVWVTAEDSKAALTKAAPHLAAHVDAGRLEIIPISQWRSMDGPSGGAVVSMLDKAVSGGFEGIRLAFDAPLEKAYGTHAPHEVDAISRHNALAVFAHRRDEFDALGLMEVLKNHQFALVWNADKWEVIESSEARVLRDELKRSEELYRSLFENMLNGFAYCRMLFEGNKPADFIYLAVNAAFEKLTGLRGVVGKRVTEVIPGIRESDSGLFDIYGRVALTGVPEQFETYVDALKMWFSISVYSPKKGHFVAIFDVITARKSAEEEIRRLNEELKTRIADLSAANALMRDQQRAALNMMEDAEIARRQTEEAYRELQREVAERRRAEEEIRRRAEELRLANDELERFNRAAVGRELLMIELKKEVNELRARIGEPPQYPLEFEEE